MITYLEPWENSFGSRKYFVWIEKCFCVVCHRSSCWKKKLMKHLEILKSVLICLMKSLLNPSGYQTVISGKQKRWVVKLNCSNFSTTSKTKIFLYLRKVIEYSFDLPEISNSVERQFPMMNSIWSQRKHLLKKQQ